MEITTIVFLTIILLLWYYYWYQRPSKLPPGPRGIPILGYAPFAGKKPEKTAYNLSKAYGPIMSIRFGRTDWLFLNDFESINQALVKQSTKFSGRGASIFDKACPAKGIFLREYGETWKVQRRFGVKTLRGYGFGNKGMEDFCLQELSYLLEEIRFAHGKSFDISGVLHCAVSNNICNMLLGKRFDYADKEFNHILHSLLHMFDDPKFSAVLRITYLIQELQCVPPFSTIINSTINNYFKLIQNWIINNVNDHEESFDKKNLRDFIDTFIAEKNKGQDSSFTKHQLIQYVNELFVAGTATTSNTLLWSLLCLLHYPESQTKLRTEIFEVIGPSGKITTAKKSKMPYTNAFMQEVFRYRTILPLSVVHKTSEKAELNGYVIPKGTMVVPNIWAVHNDATFWKEPDKFMPERFLDEAGNFVPSSHVISFSVGPRHCLGEQLARMEFFIFLVGMVQKFEFVPDPKAEQLPDIETGAYGIAYVPPRYELVAKEL